MAKGRRSKPLSAALRDAAFGLADSIEELLVARPREMGAALARARRRDVAWRKAVLAEMDAEEASEEAC